MTQPQPPTNPPLYAWRRTARTFVAGAVGAITLIPTVVAFGHVGPAPIVTQLLAVSTAVTRVMAVPAVEDWVQQYLPWLSAHPDPNPPTPPSS